LSNNYTATEKIAVLCSDNLLLLDEGIGPRIAKELLENYQFPVNVSVLDRGTMGMALLSEIKEFDTILVVDAVDNTGYQPGTVVTFLPDDVAANNAFKGAHDIKFSDVLNSAQLMGYKIEGYCLGVQIANMQPPEFTIGLTPQVEAAVPKLLSSVLDFLTSRGVKVMPKESKTKKQQRAIEVANRLGQRYPGEQCLLEHSDPFTLVIAVLLSAQTTDASVNKITPELFKRWPDAVAMAGAQPTEVEQVIHSIGLYHNKAKNCVACAQTILSEFGGEVPNTMQGLIKLPGVGRKTANIVLNCAFGKAEGIAVDTHVFRIAHRLKLTTADTPNQVEQDLLRIYPSSYWSVINHIWVLFGREFCTARNPHCIECPINDLCPSRGTQYVQNHTNAH
jgi:endonuclease-3